MRIIGGRLSGLRLQVPGNLPVRPTTDLSKEALFNILANRIDFDALKVLDLFSGTGGMSLEFASRGAAEITAVDASYHCVRFLKETSARLNLGIHVTKADAFKFIAQHSGPFDLVFADPPFDHPKVRSLPTLIGEHALLRDSESLFIMEHPSSLRFDQLPSFRESRKYGYSTFSFFGLP